MKKILLMCLFACMGLSYANPHQRDAIIHNHHMGNGYQQQQAPRAKNIHIPSRYGAVYLGTLPGNPISVVGWATNQKSERKAKKSALKSCEDTGSTDCDFIVSVRNGCIAVMDRYRADGLVTTTAVWGGYHRCETKDTKKM